MTKKTTIQISVYDWALNTEVIYETDINTIEDLIALSFQFDKKVRYKKSTDENWYHHKTMIKRLFTKALNAKHMKLKVIAANDLDKVRKKQYEKEKKKEQKRLELKHSLREIEYEELQIKFHEHQRYAFGEDTIFS